VSVSDERRLDIAAFRYRVIAEAADANGAGVTDAVRDGAQRTHTDMDNQQVTITGRTLWRWLRAYRKGGLLALRPAARSTRGAARAIKPTLLALAYRLRRKNPQRPTKTIIDILVRGGRAPPHEIARSTLDRHLARAGLSRLVLRTTGRKTFRKVKTDAPFELVVGDFKHGPYVRVGAADDLRKSLLCAFIDHHSRYVPQGRYFLHEDFAALRFSFRRLTLAYGLMEKVYLDNGPAFQANRFHAACGALGVNPVHSIAYTSEGRGVIERFNRTVKEQFETEVRRREEPPTLDELNAYFEAWLSERYHRDVHAEIGEPPGERFARLMRDRPAPDPVLLDEWMRLKDRRTVHKKWSTVEVGGVRYVVSPSLRGRRVDVLHDPFDRAHVLVAFDGRIVERALPQKPGEVPADLPTPPADGPDVDYLALVKADYDRRTHAELAALRLRPPTPQAELSLPDLATLVERCRGRELAAAEKSDVSALWRRMRPIDPQAARLALDRARRRSGDRLHVRVYLDALRDHLLRERTRTKGHKPP
jgi:transposase InsO family protein